MTHNENVNFQLRSDATTFVPEATPPTNADSDFLHSLCQAWTTTAWSWEDEEASCDILIWFADHAAHMPHGLYPRRLKL